MKNEGKHNNKENKQDKSLIMLVLLAIIIFLLWIISYLIMNNSNNTSSETSESKNTSTDSTTEASELPDCCTIDENGNTVSSGDAQHSSKETSDTTVNKVDIITDTEYTAEQQRENLQSALSYTMKLGDIQINYSTVDESNMEHEKVILLRHGIIYENGENTGITMTPADVLIDLYPNLEDFTEAKYERTINGYDIYKYEVGDKIYQVNTSRNNDEQLFIKSIFEKYKDNQENYISYVGIRDKSDFPD